MNKNARFQRLAGADFTVVSSTGVRSGTSAGRPGGVWGYRELLRLLVRRDLQARYRDSFLGFLWTLLRPLVLFGMYFVVLGQVLGAARGIPDFAVYLFSGLTIFGLFSDTVVSATSSILANAGLVKKVYIPRQLYPLAAAGGASFMFAMQLIVLIVAAVALQSVSVDSGLLWFIPSVALVLLYATALGILLSALNVYLRDIQYLVEIAVMLTLWASPVLYSWSMVKTVMAQFHLPDWFLEFYTNNPITLAVLGFHHVFWRSGTDADYPDALAIRMAVAFVVGIILLLVSQRVFARLQGNFAQEL